ncbi:hypothetical protein [Algibacter pectinivorans]|uniref:SGNH/GDSL hydrolase family protein n=1 Tax=Algibacter pectinivorans TaxID=870482 RepID=A0A1I1PD50_9FLAO|nr:hypothetical protein [Algibacter pectinivorans]SFD07522.1 hypothetical protein SAMN04487987_103385 [Algibacter pectinivorans]
MTTEIKRVTLLILKFAVVILVIDFCFGIVAKKLFLSQETGKFARSSYVINQSKDAIMVIGSSHAIRHYKPSIIEKSTGKTCYNAGAEGQQLIYHTALQKMLLKRHRPELIVFNIDEEFLFKSDIAFSRLSDLHPYYGDNKATLNPFLKLKSKYKDLKLLFKAYQYNSTIVHVLKYKFAPQIAQKGYRPLKEEMTPEKLVSYTQHPPKKIYTEQIEPIFVQLLKDFISETKKHNVKLIFVSSPKLIERDLSKNESFTTIQAIAKAEGIPFYNYLNKPDYINKLDLFWDPSHLNDKGATLFNNNLVKIINKHLD